MATFVTCEPGWGVSGGEEINAEQARWSTVSSVDVAGGATPLLNVPGILLTGGDPLGVTQTATPGMKVTVKAGRVVVPANTADKPPFMMTLKVNTDLDISAAHATNPRIDLVIAKVFSSGSDTSTVTVEILEGTPGAVPSRPTLPSGDYHCISIATVSVAAAASSIVNANITVTQSDSWSTATSDARYMAAPGGCVYQAGLVAMSATRRQAWAVLYAPGTPWYDTTAKVYGVTNGSDIVPLSTRKLYEVVTAATVQTSSTSPVTVANSGTLTVFGGTRRIRVTASGQLNCNGSADTRWMAARAFLGGAGTIAGISGGGTQAHARVWGASFNPTTVSQNHFTISRVFDAGAGTFSVSMSLLRVDAGGAGTGDTVQCVDGCLLVEDIGPA